MDASLLDPGQIAVFAVGAAILALQVALLFRRRSFGEEELEKLKSAIIGEIGLEDLKTKLAVLEQLNEKLERSLHAQIGQFGDSTSRRITELSQLQKNQFDTFANQLKQSQEASRTLLESLGAGMQKQQEKLEERVASHLKELRDGNEKKLDEMRKTVDEKLQGTLEKRLGESFKQVSDRLEQVHRGLGEMQSLANGVGDLKRVLTNVKTRGSWGEIQLGRLLEDIFSPDQYETNVRVKPESGERVEFAIKLPGRNDSNQPVYLPIDAKFPKEDYERLVEAAEAADPIALAAATKSLEIQIKKSAKDIRDKYVSPPHTTDFGVMFVPTEGLYAEIHRRPGLVEFVQREYKVAICGPSNCSAFLNSLQLGFRTLAIEKRSSEVWEVLGMVKSEFGKFGDALGQVKKKLKEASNKMDDVDVRTRALDRKLRSVEAIPQTDSSTLLEFLGETEDSDDFDDNDSP